MSIVLFITHPEVTIDPNVPVPEWSLSPLGRRRMGLFCEHRFAGRISRAFASTETKARDGAQVLAERLGLEVEIDADLGENDRSATGYLPRPEFLQVARQFFAEPERSVRGWERAVDAQHRIVRAVHRIAERNVTEDVAIVSHGGVGTLLMCHVLNHPISLALKPPAPEGGSYFALDAASFELIHGWLDLEEAAGWEGDSSG